MVRSAKTSGAVRGASVDQAMCPVGALPPWQVLVLDPQLCWSAGRISRAKVGAAMAAGIGQVLSDVGIPPHAATSARAIDERRTASRLTRGRRSTRCGCVGYPPYRNSGSQSVIPGQMYMNTRQMRTMTMYGIIPAKIWFSVTCFGATPFR